MDVDPKVDEILAPYPAVCGWLARLRSTPGGAALVRGV